MNYCPHCLTEIKKKMTKKEIIKRYLIRRGCGFLMDEKLTKKIIEWENRKEKDDA